MSIAVDIIPGTPAVPHPPVGPNWPDKLPSGDSWTKTTPAKMPQPSESAPAAINITDRAVLLNLTLKKLGLRKKVSSDNDAITVDADRDMIGVSKAILDCVEYDAIKELDTEIRQHIRSICLPSPFRGGIFLLPNGLVEKLYDTLGEYQYRRAKLVDAFCENYQARQAEAVNRLGALYDAQDYAPLSEVRDSFCLSFEIFTFSTPLALKGISKEIFERERDKAAATWTQATHQVRELLRAQIKMLVDRAADRLQPGKDGKPRIFRDTLVANITDFLDTFSARNIADDKDLADVMDKMRDLAAGLDPQDLREDAELRSRIQSQFACLASELDGMIVNRPSRRIELDEED